MAIDVLRFNERDESHIGKSNNFANHLFYLS